MAESIFCGEAGAPLAKYPHAKRVGNMLYLSGLSARQPDNSVRGVIHTENGVECSIKEQTEGIIENMKRILAQVGASLDNVIDLTVFLKDMNHYAEFNEVYNKYFSAESGPARTCVGVTSLPGPHLLIEIKAMAYITLQ